MICGIDEAGRGPVIGPLVIAGVLASEEDIEALLKMGVKDSKKLSKEKRSKLYEKIKENYKCYSLKVTPNELDSLRKSMSLNIIEAIKFGEIINVLKPKIAFVDAADVVPSNFKKAIEKSLKHPTTLIVEHKADEKYPIVSAASIIAKVERDETIKKLSLKYGDMGSGYPSDPLTQKFLKEWYQKNRSFPDFVRKSWKTVEALKNSRITEFF
ncbi:MAG: ribonuclease HII [Candidatus Hydrothermarchaeales archaeon]